MHKLKELKVWNKAISLSIEIYNISKGFPLEEKYGLTSQMRRCSISIASNIAEGAGRNSKNEFIHFLSIANGSCYELQTQLIIANKLNFVSDEILQSVEIVIEEIQKMIYRFQDTLNSVK